MNIVMDRTVRTQLKVPLLIILFVILTACSRTAPRETLTEDLAAAAESFAEEQVVTDSSVAEAETIVLEAELVVVEAPVQTIVEAPVEATVEEPVEAIVEAPVQVAEVVEVVEEPTAVPTPAPVEPEGVVIDPASLDPNSNAIGYYKIFTASSDGSGRDMTLSLLPNGNVQWRIDMHNGQEPVIEIGTWVAGDETITVRLAGFEHSSENISAEYVFTRSGDFLYSGEFMGDTVLLYRFRALAAGAVAPMYDTSMAQSRIQDTSFAGTYKAMLAASDSPGRDATITLNEGGSLNWVTYSLNRPEPTMESGSWTVDGDKVALLVTERNGKQLSTPKLYTFALTNGVLHSEKLATNLYALPDLFLVGGAGVQTGNN